MSMQTKETGLGLIERQAQLLHNFAPVADVLRGVAAVLWLPGLRQRFDGPRRISGTRPLAVTLEVTDSGGLQVSGAVSWPKDSRLSYDCIFRYEFTSPMRPDARGETLSSKNEVIARRALGMLTALIRFGEKRAYQPKAAKLGELAHPRFLVGLRADSYVDGAIDEAKLTELASDMAPNLVEVYRSKLRHELCDRTTLPGMVLVDSRIMDDNLVADAINQGVGYEDFSPVLGIPHWNPVHWLHEMPNPAEGLLGKHGVTDFDSVTSEQFDALAADFRSALPLGERLTDEEICEALCNPQAPVRCERGVIGLPPSRIVEAMRHAAGKSRAAIEATHDDFLRAARNPDGPLVLSRLSKTQLVAAEDLSILPEPYCGHFLPQADWAPPRRRTVNV